QQDEARLAPEPPTGPCPHRDGGATAARLHALSSLGEGRQGRLAPAHRQWSASRRTLQLDTDEPGNSILPQLRGGTRPNNILAETGTSGTTPTMVAPWERTETWKRAGNPFNFVMLTRAGF